MNDAVIGLIGTILGTILGFALSEISNYIRQNREFRQQKQGFISLLMLDLQAHIQGIQHLAQNIDLITPQRNYSSTVTLSPIWNIEMWSSQLPFLTSVLTSKQLKQIYTFYSETDSLVEIQKEIEQEQNIDRFNMLKQHLHQHASNALAIGIPLQEEIKKITKQ